MKNYRALFERAIADLRSNPDIEVEVAEIRDADSPAEIVDIEEAFGLRLPDAVKDFYGQIGSTEIAWRFSEPLSRGKFGDYEVTGGIKILPVHDVFWGRRDMGWHDILFFDFMKGAELKRMRALKPIEFFDSEDNGSVSLTVDGSEVSSRVILFSTDNGYHPLDLELERYIELVTQAKGLFQWQFLMAKSSKAAKSDLFKAKIDQFLPRLFDTKEQSKAFLDSLKAVKPAPKARRARAQ